MQISKLMTSSVAPREDASQNQEYLSKCNSDMIQIGMSNNPYLAYGTRARSARGSQNRAILSIIVNHLPFHRKQCISVVRVDLPRRKEAI